MMAKLIYVIFSALLILSVSSCKQEKKESSANSNKLYEDSLIFEKASSQGNLIAMETQKTLGSNLMKAVKEGGVISALNFCNLNAYPLVDSLEKKFNVEIRRASLKTRNPENAPTDLKKEIIQQFEKLLIEGKSGDPMVKKLDKNTLMYVKPIILDNTMCLNCHGAPGTDIKTEEYEHIKKLYPEDKAINYKISDLRGIWSIKFSTSNLVH